MAIALNRFFIVCAVGLIVGGSVIGQVKGAKSVPQTSKAEGCFTTITKNDWPLLLKALPPDKLQQFNEDADLRAKQTLELRDLLAIACQATRDGYLKDPALAAEFDYIRNETVAVEYDKAFRGGKQDAQFQSIKKPRIDAFYAVKGNSDRFERFLQEKLALLKADDPNGAETKVTPEMRDQAKDVFAKVILSEADSHHIPPAAARKFWPAVELNVHLQQAEFLATHYSDKMAKQGMATDDEIAKYIAAHPELDPAKKKALAATVLERAKKGDDFAKLADQYSEDPGNIGEQGQKNGGLYTDVGIGAMIPEFEKAALSVEPGHVYPELVESKYGYHVIKLEKKSVTKNPDGTENTVYDVRHVLISTEVDDHGQSTPVNDFVRATIENAKQKELIDKIVAENPVSIAQYVPPPAVKKPAANK